MSVRASKFKASSQDPRLHRDSRRPSSFSESSKRDGSAQVPSPVQSSMMSACTEPFPVCFNAMSTRITKAPARLAATKFL